VFCNDLNRTEDTFVLKMLKMTHFQLKLLYIISVKSINLL